MVSKNKSLTAALYVYAFIIMMISYTAFNSPFMSDNYTRLILINSIVVSASVFYISDSKKWMSAWKEGKAAAKKRRAYENAVKKRVNEEMKRNGY